MAACGGMPGRGCAPTSISVAHRCTPASALRADTGNAAHAAAHSASAVSSEVSGSSSGSATEPGSAAVDMPGVVGAVCVEVPVPVLVPVAATVPVLSLTWSQSAPSKALDADPVADPLLPVLGYAEGCATRMLRPWGAMYTVSSSCGVAVLAVMTMVVVMVTMIVVIAVVVVVVGVVVLVVVVVAAVTTMVVAAVVVAVAMAVVHHHHPSRLPPLSTMMTNTNTTKTAPPNCALPTTPRSTHLVRPVQKRHQPVAPLPYYPLHHRHHRRHLLVVRLGQGRRQRLGGSRGQLGGAHRVQRSWQKGVRLHRQHQLRGVEPQQAHTHG